jgi:hypothetical protein
MKNIRFIQIFFICLGIAVAIFFLNFFTPMVLDDCAWATDAAGRLSAGGIFRLRIGAYMSGDGAILPHTVAQLLCAVTDKLLFDILNALVYGAFVFALCRHAGLGERKFPTAVLCVWVLAAVWFVLPDQFFTTRSVVGSVNNLWAAALVLWWILFFTRVAVNEKRPGAIRAVLYVLFSLVSGAFVDFWSVPVILGVVLWMLVKRVKPRRAVWLSLGGFLGGVLVVALAPGSFARLTAPGDIAVLWGRIAFPMLILAAIVILKLLVSLRWKKFWGYVVTVLVVVALVWSYQRELGSAMWNSAVYNDLVLQLKGGNTRPVLRRGGDFSRTKGTFDNGVLHMEPEFWGNVAFARFWNVRSASVLPATVYDGFYVSPDAAAPDTDYYVMPLDSRASRVERIVLIFSSTDGVVLKPLFARLFGESFVARWFAGVRYESFAGRVFCKRRPSVLTFTRSDGDEPFADVVWGASRHLVVRRPAGYRAEELLGIDIFPLPPVAAPLSLSHPLDNAQQQ